ncbi:DUF309 domain-containing protein [Polyangium mundeleinium]|uniref:DUF309 domain-containing protein n=1 Tax=Polyangium mundeleinium TaxID=2995306 RepID=A0ABT5F472_9BACT|nr:DUF309 domain-containing protein [Polyangium mundeleinium]MDC0748898.1 DUF309 domain-containing protein [Polyangium mundeleinium]
MHPPFQTPTWSCIVSHAAMADDANEDREAAFNRGLEAYHAGCHFDAYDIWTQVYQDEQNETNRRFLQAIIQVTNAMHKVRHNAELRGSVHLLERALIKLDALPDVHGGIDLATFRDATRTCLAEIKRLLSLAQKNLEDAFIPPLKSVGAGPVLEPRVSPPSKDPETLFQNALDAYAAERFYDAHELWEDFRRTRPEADPARELVKGLILVATAMHKLHRAKSPSGAAQLLELALDQLREAPEGTSGFDMKALVAEVSRVHADIEALEAAGAEGPIEARYIPAIRRRSE